MRHFSALITISFLLIGISESLVKLRVNSGYSSPILKWRYSLQKSWDNVPSTLFLAESNKNGWAMYSIPLSNVVLVRLQNRNNCCEERMTGNVVYVCADHSDSYCKECGRVTTKIGRSKWAEIRCSLEGRVVKVAATNSHLQIAEIEIYDGSETPAPPTPTTTMSLPAATKTLPPQVCEPQFADTEGQLEISSCTSMEVKDETRACMNMFDGSLSRNVKEGVCFVTKSNFQGWAEVKLAQLSRVNKLVFLTKGNGHGLASTIARVCVDNQKDCKPFGKVYQVKAEECTILKGDAQRVGNMIGLYIADSNLAICEMRVYGVAL